ncbi:TolC family protein [Fusobacterium sp. MFO224]|uniref:TolC family protein n=1 Tax=Fusobacterium sp. MFO224 TaxID=3378070 RepID=UPI003852DFC2
MKKYCLLMGFFALFLESYSMELTVQDVILRAKTSNNEIKIQDFEKNIRKKSKDKALKNLVLPPIRFSAEEEWDIVKDEGFGANEISAYIPLFVGGKNINSYRKASTELDISEKDQILVRNAVEELAVSKYFEALNYKRQVEISDITIRALENQKKRLEVLFAGGKLIPKSELLKVKANLQRNKSLKLENIRQEKLAMGELSKILNYPLETEYENVEFDLEKFMEDKLNIKERFGRDLTLTTLGEKEQLKVDAAKYDLNIAKSDLYPKFYLKPTFQYKDKVGDELIKRAKDDRYALEVGFSWTFAWGGTLDSVSQKRWAYEKAKLEYEDNLKGIELETQSRERRVESLYGRALASKQEADYLKENVDIDNMRYENGLITTFDYLNSVNSYRSSQAEYYEMVRNLVIATMEFENIYK